MNKRNFGRIFFAILLILCELAFADTEPEPLEQNAKSIEAADSMSVLYMFGLGYSNSALGLSYSAIGGFEKFFWGGGGELYSNLDISLYSLFLYSLNEKLFFGLRLGAMFAEDDIERLFEPFLGIPIDKFNVSLGYKFAKDTEDNSITLRASYQFKEVFDKRDSPSFLRSGIEFNYPIWRSEIDFFDNSFPYTTSTFPYMAAGTGLFLRIGPESFYFTTGAYAKADALEKQMAMDFNAFGITSATLPFLDITYNRIFAEFPLLMGYGSGQIKFTGGVLLDYLVNKDYNVSISEDIPIVGGTEIDLFKEMLRGDIDRGWCDFYWVLGLDFDISKNWGIGVKFLMWDSNFSHKDFIDPSHYQTRVSIYLL